MISFLCLNFIHISTNDRFLSDTAPLSPLFRTLSNAQEAREPQLQFHPRVRWKGCPTRVSPAGPLLPPSRRRISETSYMYVSIDLGRYTSFASQHRPLGTTTRLSSLTTTSSRFTPTTWRMIFTLGSAGCLSTTEKEEKPRLDKGEKETCD